MNVWLLIASVACAATWAIHTFVGELTIVRPFVSATGLDPVPKWTQFYCWHLVTLTLAAMALGLAYAAFEPAANDVALLIAILALAFGAFGLLLPSRVGQHFATMPQGLLLMPIGLVALVGVLR